MPPTAPDLALPPDRVVVGALAATVLTRYIQTLLFDVGRLDVTAFAAMSAVLSEEDVTGLAAHYARQRARAVLYVPLPSK